MKTLLLTALLTVATVGMAHAAHHHRVKYSACIHNNSKTCTDARNAFAEHHNGKYPEQYFNQWYQGHQGRWSKQGKEWQWEGLDGEEYRKEGKAWRWSGLSQGHAHDYY